MKPPALPGEAAARDDGHRRRQQLQSAAWLADEFGSRGMYATAAFSGLADVDAIALSSLRLAGQHALTLHQAVTAIAVALCSNMVFKLGIAGFAGGKSFLVRCAPGMAATMAGLAAGVALFA